MKLFSEKVLNLMRRLGIIKEVIDLKESKSKTIYPRHNTSGKLINVVNFLKECLNHTNQRIIEQSAKYDGLSDDEKVLRITQWVHYHLNYVSDLENWKVREYWANPIETLDKRQGDCEDGAILIFTLARLSGVPANRIRITTGDVQANNGSQGHCWVTYTADDLNDYVLDWCYWFRESERAFKKITSEDMKKYKTRWWHCNDNRGYKR